MFALACDPGVPSVAAEGTAELKRVMMLAVISTGGGSG
jgi:hypothetical protein